MLAIEQLKSKLDLMNTDELTKAHRLVREIVFKAKRSKDDAKIEKIQADLSKQMANRWQIEANRAINKMDKQVLKGKGKFTKADKNKMVKIAMSQLSNYGDKYSKEIEKAIAEIFAIGKAKFFRTNIKQVQKAKKLTAKDFAVRDEALVEGVAAQYKTAVNVYYENNLSEVLVNLIDDVMFDPEGNGLAKADAYEEIIERLKENLGLDEQDLGGLKPPGFAGTARQYFENEIQTTVTRARAWGNISALEEAEVTEYVIVNPDPISEICQFMNGRVFKTEIAVKQMESMLDAEDPEDLAEVTPWVKDLSDFGVSSSSLKLTNEKTNTKIQESGLSAPPYHSKCKSEIEIFIR